MMLHDAVPCKPFTTALGRFKKPIRFRRRPPGKREAVVRLQAAAKTVLVGRPSLHSRPFPAQWTAATACTTRTTSIPITTHDADDDSSYHNYCSSSLRPQASSSSSPSSSSSSSYYYYYYYCYCYHHYDGDYYDDDYSITTTAVATTTKTAIARRPLPLSLPTTTQ